MSRMFRLAFYALVLAHTAIAQDITLSFENKTDRPVIFKSLSRAYSVFVEESEIDEQEDTAFLESGKSRRIEFTVVSDSYFQNRDRRTGADDGAIPPSYADRLCLSIDGEDFTVYWDLEQTTSVWKPKAFTSTRNGKYEVQMSQKQNISHQGVPYSYILSLTKKVT